MIGQDENKLVGGQLAEAEMEEAPETPVGDSQDESQSQKRGGQSIWVLFIVGLLVGGLAGFSLRPLVIPEPEANAAAPLAAVEDSGQINEPNPHQAIMLAVIDGSRHFQGDANAPVTLVEFGDFNCGYCGKWAAETLPLINEKYIETGKVRMAYVHYPILGADSMTAAEATECAAEQDRFWDYHNLLYARQGIGFTPANLKTLAGELGLDPNVFEECLANFADREQLENDIRLARVMGVRGTPAFLVNGFPLAGAYPYEDFERLIEGILAGEFE